MKPRVLIADDSRIVRATLIKHVQGMFEFKEAVDGEQAWEILLLDPNIRVLITDLTMPKLDGYGLLKRIRDSKIGRIRDIPVVVVSGSDEQEERDKVMAAGATDLITKGIGTAQLLSRLDILSKLVNTQREYESGLEVLVKRASGTQIQTAQLASPYALREQAETMLAQAIRLHKNFILLNVCIGFRQKNTGDVISDFARDDVIQAIGQLLQGTIRQTDCVARTADAEFTVVTTSVNFDSARNFAERLCKAISSAKILENQAVSVVASCGLVSLCEFDLSVPNQIPTLNAIWDIANRRGASGVKQADYCVITWQQEALL